jgi:hypothetical protein
MLRRSKIVTKKETELTENIKREIKNRLGLKGIVVSTVNMNIAPECISICISLNSSRRLA